MLFGYRYWLLVLLVSLPVLGQAKEVQGEIRIGALVSGQVVKVYVKPNQKVAKGQKLLEIDGDAYRARLALLQAQLAQEELKLADAKIELDRQLDLFDRTVTAKRKLDLARLAYDVQSQKVKAATAQVQLHKAWQKYYHIVAPVKGRVIKVFAPVGTTVFKENTPLILMKAW